MKIRRKISLELVILFVVIFFGIFSAFLAYSTTAGRKYSPDNHLVLLAERFNQRKISLNPINRPEQDVVDWYANFYLYFGPFSSLFLTPFVFMFGRNFPQVFLGGVSLLVSFLAIYKITSLFEYSERDSLWLSIFFVFSTVLFGVGVICLSAYQVQALGTALVLVSFAEWFGKRRFWLVGLFVALAGLTRLTLYLSLTFFLLEWLRLKLKKRKLIMLLIPVFLSILVLFAYNHRRFGSIMETGYEKNVTLENYPMSENIKRGFFSWEHISSNLYVLLLKTPDPVIEGGGYVLRFPFLKADPWGMAIWVNSPLLLMLFKKKKAQHSNSALITVLLLLIPSVTYFGIGFSQFGYRYALDFLPFLFLLLLPNLGPRLSRASKLLIVIGVAFNCVYLTSLWGIYPHFLLDTYSGKLVGGFSTSFIPQDKPILR